MKHTPGPWKKSSDGQVVSTEDFSIVVSKPNASLIAAAPDMLEELEQLREALNDSVLSTGSKTMDEEMLYNIQKIIKKAKGE